MVSYQKLKKKFPVKKGSLPKSKKAAAIKAIAQEYEIKKAELGMGPPQFKRGFPYYMVIIIGLLIVGALVGSAISERGGIDIAQQNVKKTEKSLFNLAIALGRYRYHVGTFPATEEGLEQLSQTRLSVPGWVGPYIKAVKSDPWKNPYVYVYNGETSLPTLFSKGPDGKAGTPDDLIANPEDFDAAFRDTSWTEGWVPWHLRDIILADSKAHKVIIERQVADALAKNSITDGGVEICDGWKFSDEGAKGVEVSLPHDWAAPGLTAGSGFKRGTYTRSFFAERELEGKFVALRLDGVAGEFKVRLNGKDLLARNAGEYGHEIDLGGAIKYGGDNLLEIDVESNDRRKGAGITAKATLVAEENDGRVVYGSLRVTALRADAKTANIRVERKVVKVEDGAEKVLSEKRDFDVVKPRLWEHAKPRMNKGNMTGRYAVQALEKCSPDSVFLNGRKVRLNVAEMVCDFGLTGHAYHEMLAYARLRRLKEAGVNTVLLRDGSFPYSFCILAAENGVLVIDETQVKELGLDEKNFVKAWGFLDERFYCSLRAKFLSDSKMVWVSPWAGKAEGENVTVECVSAGDAAKLYVNGEFRGDGKKADDGCFVWSVPYEIGEAKVMVFKNGVYFSEAVSKTAFEAKALVFETRQATVLAEGDVAEVDVFVIDDYGVKLASALEKVEFALEGPGEIIACGNGAGAKGEFVSGKAASVAIEGGRASVAVRRGGGSGGVLKLYAKGHGMRTALFVLPRGIK